MNQKQRQRLGSAIVSTMLSFAALSLAAVDRRTSPPGPKALDMGKSRLRRPSPSF